jgi:ribosome-associated protein
LPRRQTVAIRTETIALGALLKWAGVAATGGEAKTLIAGRRVLVNGQVETRRGRRVGDGDLVAVQGGPTMLVTRVNGVPAPPALASDVP